MASQFFICFRATHDKYIHLSLFIFVECVIKNAGLVDIFVQFSLMALSIELLEVVM